MVLNGIAGPVRQILEIALAGDDVTPEQGEVLCRTEGAELDALAATANELRERQAGRLGTYVVNRNINFTNACIKHCSFCAFSRDPAHDETYFVPIERVVELAREAWSLGASEVCIQAGLPPRLDGWHYVKLVAALKRELPDLHVHAFSPEEVKYGAQSARVSVREYLIALKEAGHDTIPGTSAEILDDQIRKVLAEKRLSSAEWINVITTAHEVGLRTTATILYGHIETYADWTRHMALLRRIQQRTGGFTEFVPLSFVHEETPLHRDGRVANVRRGPSGADVVKMHAVARLMLGRWMHNIQASWVKEGPRMAQFLLHAGANDLGGTLLNESISTTAGASHGQFLAPSELRRMIRESGLIPAERTTTYAIRRRFDEDPAPDSALDQILDPEQRFGSYRRMLGSSEYRYRSPLREARER